METLSNDNKFIATTWLLLAIVLIIAGIYILFTQGQYLAPAFIGLSIILIIFSRQKTEKQIIEKNLAEKLIRDLSLFVILSTIFGGILMTNT